MRWELGWADGTAADAHALPILTSRTPRSCVESNDTSASGPLLAIEVCVLRHGSLASSISMTLTPIVSVSTHAS